MLVLPVSGEATLVVPRLEAPRVEERPDVFALRPWDETEDPVAIVAGLAGRPATAAVGDRTWARFVLDLQRQLPGTSWRRASEITGPLRAVKGQDEVAALRRAAEAADRVAAALQAGDIPLVGRTEADVSAELGRRLVEEGHARVNFAIVGSGPNAASPHHEPGERIVEVGDSIVCDFGGTMAGYCSDITRTFVVGEPPADLVDLYDVLFEAQEQAVRAARVGVTCEQVDAAARSVIAAAGYGDYFIHRTGHGIGLEEHEDPYLVSGNATPLAPGHAFSVEPGIYLPGRCGARIEDIVVATEDGPERLNDAPRALAVVG
jgi:Xaa-Pro aminopeptidase